MANNVRNKLLPPPQRLATTQEDSGEDEDKKNTAAPATATGAFDAGKQGTPERSPSSQIPHQQIISRKHSNRNPNGLAVTLLPDLRRHTHTPSGPDSDNTRYTPPLPGEPLAVSDSQANQNNYDAISAKISILEIVIAKAKHENNVIFDNNTLKALAHYKELFLERDFNNKKLTKERTENIIKEYEFVTDFLKNLLQPNQTKYNLDKLKMFDKIVANMFTYGFLKN